MNRNRQWGIAWIVLDIALAIHVADEALTDFLPLYNSLVESGRESFGWLPFPTFTFEAWLGGLIIGVLVLLALSPLVFTGKAAMRPLAYFLGVLMTVNALAHIGASIIWATLAPGVLSSPVLLAAAIALLVTTRRASRRAG